MAQRVSEDQRGQAGAGAREGQPVRCSAGRTLAGGGGGCPKGGTGMRGEPVGVSSQNCEQRVRDGTEEAMSTGAGDRGGNRRGWPNTHFTKALPENGRGHRPGDFLRPKQGQPRTSTARDQTQNHRPWQRKQHYSQAGAHVLGRTDGQTRHTHSGGWHVRRRPRHRRLLRSHSVLEGTER